jgi:hypothetical protein
MGDPSYNAGMFLRRKKNNSGSISVQILKKEGRSVILVETVGCGKVEEAIQKIEERGKHRLQELLSQQSFDFLSTERDGIISDYLGKTETLQVQVVGSELILGKIFDSIGLGAIPESLFRHIVLARLVYPVSKLKTTEYLAENHCINVDVSTVYRFLDRFHKQYKDKVELIVYEHSKKTLKNISVVFYDMTTLYFEAEDEDDLRKIGFSKDGKFQCPQIMIGLLVGENGYPIAYDMFEGNLFEGHTMIPLIEQMQKKYNLTKPIIVADSGLLSKDNVKKLLEQNYEFILGARIKNETQKIQSAILEQTKNIKNGKSIVLKKPDKTRLIVNFSEKRARKDAHNRDKGLKKLREKFVSGKLTKEQVNNRGYNKFLTLENEVKVSMNESKIVEDKKWDGLKGYMTNTNLSSEKTIDHYKHLWQIEKAFRISKTDLRIRPIFHRKKDRIEAHLCIAFAAYAVYKELEKQLREKKLSLSPARAITLTKTIYQLSFLLPDSGKFQKRLLPLSDSQKSLLSIFHSSEE